MSDYVMQQWPGPPGRTPPGFEPPEPPPDSFPPAGIDIIYHQLRIRLDVGKKDRGDETIHMLGKMLIERGDPYTNDEGLRQIDFHVRAWEAAGWSWTLKQVLSYVLSENEDQPVSRIVAEQKENDFPALFSFNVIFDARVNNAVVFRAHHGRPEGHGFRVVPPNGDRRLSPRMTRFEDTRIAVEHPALGVIEAIPIDCNDQSSVTLATL